MVYFQNEYIILPFSTNGDNIINRDFKDKPISFRIEILTKTDEEFIRDGENSGFEYEFVTEMFIITTNNDEYDIHYYNGGIVKIFSTRSSRYLLNEKNSKTEYNESNVINTSSFAQQSDSLYYIDYLYNLYSIVRISKIEPFIKKIKTLIKKENRLLKKKKDMDKSYEENKKTKEYNQSNFSSVLEQLKRVTHCPFDNKFEINFQRIKNDSDKNVFIRSQTDLCKECYEKGIWSL